jgi:hypothetical protein
MFKNKWMNVLFVVYILGIAIFSYLLIHQQQLENYESQIKDDLLRLTILVSEMLDKDNIEYIYDSFFSWYETRDELLYEEVSSSTEMVKTLLSINVIRSETVNLIVDTYEDFTNDIVVDFGYDYDASEFPYMLQSMRERRPMVEPAIGYDAEFDVYLISAFAPIYKNAKYIGHIGVDMFVDDYNKNLLELSMNSILMAISISFIGGVVIPFLVFKFFGFIEDVEARKKRKVKRAIRKARKENK